MVHHCCAKVLNLLLKSTFDFDEAPYDRIFLDCGLLLLQSLLAIQGLQDGLIIATLSQ